MSWKSEADINMAAFAFAATWLDIFTKDRGIIDVWTITITQLLQYLLFEDVLYIEATFTEYIDGLEAWLCSGRQSRIAGQLAWHPVADVTGYAGYFDYWYHENIDRPCGFPPANKYEALQKVVFFYEHKLAQGEDLQEFFWMLRLLWDSYARNFLGDTLVTGSYWH